MIEYIRMDFFADNDNITEIVKDLKNDDYRVFEVMNNSKGDYFGLKSNQAYKKIDMVNGSNKIIKKYQEFITCFDIKDSSYSLSELPTLINGEKNSRFYKDDNKILEEL